MNQLVNYVYAVESWGNEIPRRRRDIILKQIIKAGALLCALTMLEWNATAVAEEKRLDVRPEKRRNNQPARGRRSLW